MSLRDEPVLLQDKLFMAGYEAGLKAAVEAVEELKEFEHPPSWTVRTENAAYSDAIDAINKLRDEQ